MFVCVCFWGRTTICGFDRSTSDGEVRQESAERSQEGDPQDEAREAKERQGRQGEEPQAGHRDRTFQGPKEGREGAKEKEQLKIRQRQPADAIAEAAPEWAAIDFGEGGFAGGGAFGVDEGSELAGHIAV